jgi:hypothetical protein
MCPSGVACLPADCCFNDNKSSSSSLVWYKEDTIIISSKSIIICSRRDSIIICSRHDIARLAPTQVHVIHSYLFKIERKCPFWQIIFSNYISTGHKVLHYNFLIWRGVMVLNVTFNNLSVISSRSVISSQLVEETADLL